MSLAEHASRRRKPLRLLLVSTILLPVIVVLAVLAFAWPASRLAPRDLPLGVVESGPASASLVLALDQAESGAFTVTLYGSDTAARQAIENRAVYGALEPADGRLTVLTASAASPMVAQLITQVADTIAEKSSVHGTKLTVASSDVVPTAAKDPRGLVLSSAMLPLTMCSLVVAAAIALLVALRPAWRQIAALAVVCSLTALAAYAMTQGYLGALPGQHLETLATLALMMFAMSSSVAGLIALIGPAGMALGSVMLVIVGNPFSGVTSAPELLPRAVSEIGQLLPPGAGASLLRNTAYFDGHGPALHLVVLIAWSVFGIVAIAAGHHSYVGYAARRHASWESLEVHSEHRVSQLEKI
ncbi:MAG TPA: ABC transporter permease [Actinospica sp.]|jgi:hypothetical protein|nr:ABC transporter permease [Actinospica sp.]